MSILEEILSAKQVDYSELKANEKQIYQQWQKDLESKALTLEKVRAHVSNLKRSTTDALCELPTDASNYEKNINLKARLKVYNLLESFLTSAEQSKIEFEKHLKATVSNASTPSAIPNKKKSYSLFGF